MAEIIMADPPIGNVIDKEGKPSREMGYDIGNHTIPRVTRRMEKH
jgi:hypothetical protein